MSLATRTLGRTGLEVTRLGYGAMELSGMRGAVDPRDASQLLNQVLDNGITFIDTSPDYGASEDLIGQSIAGRRDEYVLASKCGCPVAIPLELKDGRPVHDYGPENLVAAVEQSLTRMRTDHIDLVQVHMSPSRALMEQHDALGTLRDLQQQGKLRYIGMSGTLPDIADHIEMNAFDAFQIPYSGLERAHERTISDAARAGAGTIIRGGVARGAPDPERNVEEALPFWRDQMVRKRDLWEEARLDELTEGMTRMEFMLRFTLSHPDIHTIIVGSLDPAHVAGNVAAAATDGLPDDVYTEAKRRIDASM